MTTGGLPTFIDAGASFGAHSIVEDNLIAQVNPTDPSGESNILALPSPPLHLRMGEVGKKVERGKGGGGLVLTGHL